MYLSNKMNRILKRYKPVCRFNLERISFLIISVLFLFIEMVFPPEVHAQQIKSTVLDVDTEQPLGNAAITILLKSDTSIRVQVFTNESGECETQAPTIGMSMGYYIASNPFLFINTREYYEIRIADKQLATVGGAELYGMSARLVGVINKEQDGEYSLFRVDKSLLGDAPLAFQAGGYGGLLTKNGFRFSTEVAVGTPHTAGKLKSTLDLTDYIFRVEKDGYEPLSEERAVDLAQENAFTHYLQQSVQQYLFTLSGVLVPGGDTLLLLAEGTQGVDTLYNDVADPHFAVSFESEDETLTFHALAENSTAKLDSVFTKSAGTHYLTLAMQEKAALNPYFFNFGIYPIYPEGKSVVAYIRNDPFLTSDNDTLYNQVVPVNKIASFGVWSEDSQETLVTIISHPDYSSKTIIETFTPGAYARNYDLREN